MLQPLRARLSYANVMSTFAVTLALGGVSYAATALADVAHGRQAVAALRGLLGGHRGQRCGKSA